MPETSVLKAGPVEIALELYRQGNLSHARQHLRDLGGAIADDSQALEMFALCLDRGEEADAYALLERAVRVGPGDEQAHFNMGVTHQAANNFSSAIASYRAALRLQPDHTGALNNLSDLLRRRGQAREGWDLLQRYVAAGGRPAGLELRFAKMAMDCGFYAEASDWFWRAEASGEKAPEARWEHAMLLLAQEHFDAGWVRYEERLVVYGHRSLGIFPYALPIWTGERRQDLRLLLHREQGLGDMIMFASCIPEIREEVLDLHLAVHPPLVRLFDYNFKDCHVWSSVTTVTQAQQPTQPWLPFAGKLDVQAPIGSLGALRRTKGMPIPKAYLSAIPKDVEAWRDRLDLLAPRAGKRLRVGLVTTARMVTFSDDGRTNGARKSIPPELISILGKVADIQWVSLHGRETAPVLADIPDLDIVDASPWITDLADTAALIANLDLVVSVDTAVAHLAGAMGKPVFVALWRYPDWRWGLQRADSYWYPAMRLFRQEKRGDWSSVMEELCGAIASFIADAPPVPIMGG